MRPIFSISTCLARLTCSLLYPSTNSTCSAKSRSWYMRSTSSASNLSSMFRELLMFLGRRASLSTRPPLRPATRTALFPGVLSNTSPEPGLSATTHPTRFDCIRKTIKTMIELNKFLQCVLHHFGNMGRGTSLSFNSLTIITCEGQLVIESQRHT